MRKHGFIKSTCCYDIAFIECEIPNVPWIGFSSSTAIQFDCKTEGDVLANQQWQRKGNVEVITAPPNILIIGQDSTSRLNFRRHMRKTLKILESLGAVEMFGYTRGRVTK
jgi:hypothetical protein